MSGMRTKEQAWLFTLPCAWGWIDIGNGEIKGREEKVKNRDLGTGERKGCCGCATRECEVVSS